MGETLIGLLVLIAAIVAVCLGMIFIAVPLFKGVGLAIGGIFRGIGWLLAHISGFIVGMVQDAVRLVGACIAFVVFLPLMCLNIVIGRWSASGHFFRSMRRECQVASACVYRVLLQRPLRFLLLGGLLEGIEDRLDEAVAATPPADKPSRQTGKFENYRIIGSLPVGGSGAKLYVAEPSAEFSAKRPQLPGKVVIKAFALTDGSSLPQIVRESRALEAAKQLGLVLDHGMDEQRFFYVMPYHDGEHLSIITRQLHGESDTGGLDKRQLATAMSYVQDLLLTLREYHRTGLWHKDVKPENIIVHDGRAHLVDLGLVTPLRSAMTLTTHGTEYFRDPEMVRQALRGVKVHQVDGTKFDIYAAGAVMYFLLENTFPAHGGLSRFGRRSPEALRWIVRRAMTEYNQRYATVDQMLADIRHVMASAMPVNVKPVDLPSMQGDAAQAEAIRHAEAAAAEDAAAREEEARVASAGSAQSKGDAETGKVGTGVMGLAAGIGKKGPFMQVGKLSLDENGEPVWNEGAPISSRPKLRVTNWWTGAYVSEGVLPNAQQTPAPVGPHIAGPAPFIPAGHRRPASEQIASAQKRASKMSKRAASRRARFSGAFSNARHARTNKREPHAIVGMLAMTALFVTGIIIVSNIRGGNDQPSVWVDADGQLSSFDGVLAGIPGVEAPWPLIVVNDHPAKTNPLVAERIEQYMADRNGWEYITDDLDAEAQVRRLLPTGPLVDNTELTGPLGDVLADIGVVGVLHFSSVQDAAAPHDNVRVSFMICREKDYRSPLLVRTQTVPVSDVTAVASPGEASSSAAAPAPTVLPTRSNG